MCVTARRPEGPRKGTTMTRVTEPLREEHKELIPHIEELRVAADRVGIAAPEELRAAVYASHAFLAQHLVPHAKAEEAALYPVVAATMGAPEATATMSRDHVEVVRLTEELGGLRGLLQLEPAAETARALRRVLYGLYALVKVHFAKEEEVYLPILDARLTPEAGREMFERMEAAAAEAKSTALAV